MKTVYVGKASDNDIIIEDAFVSRKHLRITLQNNGEYFLEDLGSTNGTFVNGNRVQEKVLSMSDSIKIGDTILAWQSYFKPTYTPAFPMEKPLKTIRIGRRADNDFVIANSSVSQEHAILEIFPDDELVLTDLSSTNGTFLDGERITKSRLFDTTKEIQFGNEKVLLKDILRVLPQENESVFIEESPLSKGKPSFAPAKQEKKAISKKNIPFEGIAFVVVLLLAAYGGFTYWKKNNESKTETSLTKDKMQDETEKDYLTDYDEEGKLIEKEESKKQEKKSQPKTNNLEDIVENAENAIFRVDAFSNGVSQGFGTGFFVNTSGIGVSNYHVFSPGTNWQIKLKNGETYQVKHIIEENSILDYIIFETNAKNVDFLPIASEVPRKGQDVFVIGNPQGFELSVTKGIVSGIRNYNQYQGTASEGDNYVQIDAPISSGNSGGPVFNMNGEVIGIATMVINGKSGVAQNLNLAVNIQKLNIP